MGGTRSPKSLSRREAASPKDAASLGVLYHSTPYAEGFPYDEWMHVGSRDAAMNRARQVRPQDYGFAPDHPTTLHRFRLRGNVYPHVLTNELADEVWGAGHLRGLEEDGLPSGHGYHVFPYADEAEGGAHSYLVHRSAIVPVGKETVSRPHTAAAYAPSAGIFGPTTGLDHRLFNERFRLRPEVAEAIMHRLDTCIRTDSGLAGSDWQDWTRVYLTGGSASEWAGDRPNDTAQDLDIIVAIDLAEAQGHNAFEGMDAGEAASALNRAFWKYFNADNWHAPFGGIWNLTAFCNQRAWYVEQIKPYAAWDLSHAAWAVAPPHLPEHTIADFSPAVLAHARAVAAEARAILRMDEPLRTREATALWNHVHEHRCQAFSPEGTGWDDPGNVDEKYLAYHPHHLLRKIRDLAMAKTAAWDPDVYTVHPDEIGYLRARDFGDYKLRDRPWEHSADADDFERRVQDIMGTAQHEGIREPVEITPDKTLHDGAHRWEAARRLGIEIPIKRLGSAAPKTAAVVASPGEDQDDPEEFYYGRMRTRDLTPTEYPHILGTSPRVDEIRADARVSGEIREPIEVHQWTNDSTIRDGNHRWRAAMDLGIETVPVKLKRRVPGEPFGMIGPVRKTASREQQLAAMDPLTRASALAQEAVRSRHPLVTRPLHVQDGQSSVVLSTWLARHGHPLARTAYITGQPGTDYSCTGRGPDGEPAVMLHRDRRDYGTLAHEAAHLIDDQETGRAHRTPHGPDGAHNDNWARHYAALLNQLDGGAGDRFLAERDYELSALRHEAAMEGTERRTKSDELPSGAGMVYLTVPRGKVQGGGEHHVTLAYLPRNMSDEQFDRVSEIARDAASRHQRFRGLLGGGGTFPEGADRTKKRTAFIPLDAPAAHPLQKEFAEVDRSHYPNYSPHITRAYLKPGDENPAPHPETWVNFTHVHVRRGDEVRSFPLRADEPEQSTAQQMGWRRPDKHRDQLKAIQRQRLETERWKAEQAENQRQREIEDQTLKPWAREAVSGYDGLTDRTAMIYLELPPGAVRPVPGGVDDHHITLVYLGKNVSDKAFAEACRRAQEAAAQTPSLEGVLNGIDIFPPSTSSDGKVVAFVPAYVGGIGALRRRLEDLSASEHKDYRPHVTLAYLTEGDSLPAPHPAVPLRFAHLCVKRGDDVVRFPLTGGMHSAG